MATFEIDEQLTEYASAATMRAQILAAGLLRPAVVQGRGVAQIMRAAAVPALQRRWLSAKPFKVHAPETMPFPNENIEQGQHYQLNWSLCGSGVIPQVGAFRNKKTAELAAKGGSISTAEPDEVPFSKAMYKTIKSKLGDRLLYVQDCAFGALSANEIQVRIITDSPAAALAFKTLCATTRVVPLPSYQEDVTVLCTSAEDTEWGSSFVASSKAEKVVIMHGNFNAHALIKHVSVIATDAFLNRASPALPLWGSGGPDCVFLSEGFEDVSQIQHGFAWSEKGFCRMFMGKAESDGSVVNLYDDVPNSLPPPAAVVMFADDASAALPAAAELTAEQAAFYFATACAPAGCTNFVTGAGLVMAMAKHTTFYMVNRGAFASEVAAIKAAQGLSGKKGKKGGPLDLKVPLTPAPPPAPCRPQTPPARQAQSVVSGACEASGAARDGTSR